MESEAVLTTRKRKLSRLNHQNDSLEREQSNELSPAKKQKSIVDNPSPVSSPLKGPLQKHDPQVDTPSFVPKSFYGFKSSSAALSKENNTTPKKKNIRNTTHTSSTSLKPKILQDTHLNEKLLDIIADSPVKQAVLQQCSVEEFRKLFRDEIKEIEQEKKFEDRRITRKLSKIVCKRNDSADNNDGWDESSNEGISFKISNRGFDAESVSNCSSSVYSDKVITPDKKQQLTKSPTSSLSEQTPKSNKSSQENVSTPTSGGSERKFFKSKSVRESVGASNVLLGRGFNLRFVRQSRTNSAKKKGRKVNSPNTNSTKKSYTLAEKFRSATQQSPFGSSVLTASSSFSTNDEVESTSVVSSPNATLNLNTSTSSTANNVTPLVDVSKTGKYTADDFEDDEADNFLSKDNNCSVAETRDCYSSGNESPYDSVGECSFSDENICEEAAEDETKADDDTKNDQSDLGDQESSSAKKLFPIFRKSVRTKKIDKSPPNTTTNPNTRPRRSVSKAVKDDSQQMIIDAGQRNFGATQCSVCGMIYSQADPTDETAHAKFHKRLLEVLKYPGWKKERVVQEMPFDCAKVVMVMADDPPNHRKRIDEIYEVMGRELGFPGDQPFGNPYRKVFLYISVDKEIEGCCVAESIKEGNRVIPGDLDASDASGKRPWCCEKTPQPALMGISRLWVASQKRGNGVASRLVEAVRHFFDYGSVIPKDKIAFSDPTPDGRRFAQKYIGTATFLVYKYKC